MEKVTESVAASLSLTMVVLTRELDKLTNRVEELVEERQKQILTAEEAAQLLGFKSVTAFEQVVRREGIPKHYISERHPRYLRSELYEYVARN